MNNDKTILAWHFTDGNKLRDGSPLPKQGEWLKLPGPPVMCSYGFHASVRLLDAADYAPGTTLHRVRIGGDIISGGDKIVGTERKIIWTLDATIADTVLRAFARWAALQVIDLWAAPDIVIRYLKTGDESIRDAAATRARSATWAATWGAAAAAASAATRARSATWAATRARSATWAATWDADAAAAKAAAAASAAASAAQNSKLTAMIFSAHKEE